MAALAATVLTGAAGCGDDACTPEWTTVVSGETAIDRSVLSVWGAGPDTVYVAGGPLGVAGREGLIAHFDGARWVKIPTGRPETLWWVWGAAREDVWAVGEGGLILRWNGAALSQVPSGTTTTLWGVFGASPDDVWIVGGGPGAEGGLEDDVVLRWNGQTLERDTTVPQRGVALYKVWGASADDVWVVGEAGTILRWRNGTWQDFTDADLTFYNVFTVHGCAADEVYAVGGPRVLGFDGTTWRELDVGVAGFSANGVSCGADAVLVVGNGGLKLRFDRASMAWIDEQFVDPWDTDFHGALVNTDGSMWAVGGDFLAPASPDRQGVIGYRGCEPPPADLKSRGFWP